MQTFNRSKYNISWISIIVIFIGAIVYPITFYHTKKTSKNLSVQVVPIDFSDLTAKPNEIIAPASQTEVKETPKTANLVFKRDLKIGDKGPDVKKLQEYLNGRGFIVSETGNGSPGNETELFGPGTARALKEFQETYADILLAPFGLEEGTGFFGQATRNFINS